MVEDSPERIEAMAADRELTRAAREFETLSGEYKYTYNFEWLGRPIIQYPQDILAMQEIIWTVKPRAIVETGIAHGGTLVFYASMLQLLGGDGRVVGVDVDIRKHNRVAIEAHPMYDRISMIEGSSVDPAIAVQVREAVGGREPVLVALDSNHTEEHVLAELELYSPLVTTGSYLVVFDTGVEEMPGDRFPDRPWGPGNNPMTAVRKFLSRTDRFEVDDLIDKKLVISASRSGYLRCVR